MTDHVEYSHDFASLNNSDIDAGIRIRPVWSLQREAEAIFLVRDCGLTARLVAERLKTTRNAIIGMLYRASMRGTYIRPRAAASKPPSSCIAPDPGRGCRWIDGDPRQPGWTFCGEPVEHGGSWCKAHHARVFTAEKKP
jgi:GcrA cell cycle regulator